MLPQQLPHHFRGPTSLPLVSDNMPLCHSYATTTCTKGTSRNTVLGHGPAAEHYQGSRARLSHSLQRFPSLSLFKFPDFLCFSAFFLCLYYLDRLFYGFSALFCGLCHSYFVSLPFPVHPRCSVVLFLTVASCFDPVL